MAAVYDYISEQPGDLADFVELIHNKSLKFRKNPPTRILSFHAKNDSIGESGLFEILTPYHGATVKDKTTGWSRSILQEHPELKMWNHLCVAATWFYEYLDEYVDIEDIPDTKAFGLYFYLFSICMNVQVIEVPKEWVNAFRYAWRDEYFTKVDKNIEEELEDGRIRWGKLTEDDDIEDEDMDDDDEEDGDNNIELMDADAEGEDEEIDWMAVDDELVTGLGDLGEGNSIARPKVEVQAEQDRQIAAIAAHYRQKPRYRDILG